MVNRTFTPGQLASLRGAGIVPMYYCADCRVEVTPERWPNHYRTAAHRKNLAASHPSEAVGLRPR